MEKPQIGKIYVFVRQNGGVLEHTEFARHEDGSAGFAANGFYAIHENHEDAWRNALAELTALGFVELREAIASGVAPEGWQPTPESFVLKHGQAAVAREA